MSAQSLWLVRHGQTEWSVLGRHTSRTDLDLTAAGEAEAVALKPLLLPVHFELVLSSPRKRAIRTAQLAGFAPEISSSLEEWDYGDLEGMTTAQIRELYPGWSIWDGPWPGGEEPDEVGARADEALRPVLSLPSWSAALIFAHGHIMRVIAARWLRRPPTDGRLFVLGTATLSVLGWEHGDPAVDRWNMPAHPPAAAAVPTAATSEA